MTRIIQRTGQESPASSSLTMDAFVKWREGELKGYAGRFLERLSIKLFCMEEFESFDIYQVLAALGNVPIQTLLMVT